MQERRLGPVVGLGAWNTVLWGEHPEWLEPARENASAGSAPWLGPEERRYLEEFAG